jgi:hypothetical protein
LDWRVTSHLAELMERELEPWLALDGGLPAPLPALVALTSA